MRENLATKEREAIRALRRGETIDGKPLNFATIAMRAFQERREYYQSIRLAETAAIAALRGRKFHG